MKSVNEMNFEQFKSKFDTNFITESEIINLFNYRHNGFRFVYPNKTGKKVLKKFCEKFTDIYSNKGCIYESHETYGSNGRDITIRHTVGDSHVYYASEYPCCGNGDYYLVANPKLLLFLERD